MTTDTCARQRLIALELVVAELDRTIREQATELATLRAEVVRMKQDLAHLARYTTETKR